MRLCIVGGGAALAKPLIEHFTGDCGSGSDCYLDRAYPERSDVTAVCRTTPPEVPGTNVVFGLEGVEGHIDVLITLPGSVRNGRIEELSLDDWRSVVDATLNSVFEAFHRLLPRMTDGGNVVVVGSVVGSTGGYGCANYAAAKAGLVSLVRAAANEYLRLHINLLELGYVDIGMGARLPEKVKEKVRASIPLGRFATEEDVVLAVDFLARTKYMTGEKLTLGGGLR